MGAHGYIPWNEGIKWAKAHTREAPEKFDPDCVRLQEHYLLSYKKSRILKAFSYGIALDCPTLSFVHGDEELRKSWAHVFEAIRFRIPEFWPISFGHSSQIYLLNDARLIHEIKTVMNGTGGLQ